MNRRFPSGLTGASLALLLLIGSASQASVAVSNITEPYQVGLTTDGTHFATADSFTTSGAGTFTLTSFELTIQVNSAGGDTTDLRLRADAAGSPGTLVEDLGSLFAPQGQTLLTYNSVGAALLPNTTYWVSLGEAGSGGGQNWDGTFSTAETSPIGWTIGDQALFSADGGSTWQQESDGSPTNSGLFTVNVTPEPASLSILIVGGIGLCLRRRLPII